MKKILFICYLIFLPSHGMSQPQLPPVSSPSGVVLPPDLQNVYQEAQTCEQTPWVYSFSACDLIIKHWNNLAALVSRHEQDLACYDYIVRFNAQSPGPTLNPPPGQTYQSCQQMLYSR